MNSQGERRPSEYPAEWKVEFGPASPLLEGYQIGRETTRLEAGITLVHGSPRDPVWEYVTSVPVARASK